MCHQNWNYEVYIAVLDRPFVDVFCGGSVLGLGTLLVVEERARMDGYSLPWVGHLQLFGEFCASAEYFEYFPILKERVLKLARVDPLLQGPTLHHGDLLRAYFPFDWQLDHLNPWSRFRSFLLELRHSTQVAPPSHQPVLFAHSVNPSDFHRFIVSSVLYPLVWPSQSYAAPEI